MPPVLTDTRQVIAVEQRGLGHMADIDRPLSFEQMADRTANGGVHAIWFAATGPAGSGLNGSGTVPAKCRRLLDGGPGTRPGHGGHLNENGPAVGKGQDARRAIVPGG
jgi:hypothetical protein